MSLNNPYQQYRQSQIETTPKLKLIVMLYDGAIRFLQQSIPPMQDNNYEQKGLFINKSIAIISHLTGTLDYVHGGEIATNLSMIYQYMTRKLVQANFDNDPRIVHEVINQLRELRSAWSAIAAGDESQSDSAPLHSLKRISDLSLAA